MTYLARRHELQGACIVSAPSIADQRAARSRLKRSIDIAFALSLIAFLLPLLALVAVAVRASSPGPVLFRQRRTGLNGQPFQIYKFRSMTVMEDGENIRHASRGDARVTKIGAFLRKSSIDELPQLFNILKGDMSLVGPRPHAVSHDAISAPYIAS
jgi:putative colanic acid biosysnthesis UDP-glucose lipid carrier transferase